MIELESFRILTRHKWYLIYKGKNVNIEERGIWQLLVVLCALIKGSKKWWKLISERRKEEDRQIKL